VDEELRFLRPNVIVEPLVDGFYAWSHTGAPVQAAMNLAFLQVPLLESYLQSQISGTRSCRRPGDLRHARPKLNSYFPRHAGKSTPGQATLSPPCPANGNPDAKPQVKPSLTPASPSSIT
jgi:hypothetical protein